MTNILSVNLWPTLTGARQQSIMDFALKSRIILLQQALIGKELKMKSILLSILILALAGCAPKPLDRAQFVALDEATQRAMTRAYKGFSQEQLIAAAEKALLHSEKDYKIIHRKNSLSATRQWILFLVLAGLIGNDAWDVKVNGNTVKAVAWYAGGAGGTFPVPVPAKSADDPYLSPPLYDLFFDRMEYFLGLRSDWAPCAKIDKTKFLFAAGMENGNDPLCSHVKSQDPTKGGGKG
jgi:hypothetical protein